MLARLLDRRAITSSSLWNSWARGDDVSFGPSTAAGVRVNEDSALSLLSVYSCVRLIADAISTMDVDAYRDTGDARVEINPPKWITNPNPETSQIDFLNQVVVALLLRGNAYAGIVRDAGGSVRELWNLHPDEVRVARPQGQPLMYRVRGRSVPASEILHIRGLTLPGSPIGLDPITYAAAGLGLGIAAQDYGATFFAQSAVPATVIEAPGVVAQDQVEMLREQFMRWHAGMKNAHLPAVLGGGATIKAVSILPEQAQFLETRKFTDGQIRRLFGIDPFASDEASFTYANVEQRGLDVSRFTLRPWIRRIECALSGLMPHPRYIELDSDVLSRADLKTRYEAYAIGRNGGWLTENEIRDWERLPPLEPATTDPTPEAVPQPDGATPQTTGPMQ